VRLDPKPDGRALARFQPAAPTRSAQSMRGCGTAARACRDLVAVSKIRISIRRDLWQLASCWPIGRFDLAQGAVIVPTLQFGFCQLPCSGTTLGHKLSTGFVYTRNKLAPCVHAMFRVRNCVSQIPSAMAHLGASEISSVSQSIRAATNTAPWGGPSRSETRRRFGPPTPLFPGCVAWKGLRGD